jgi:hypothetical protein
MHVLKFASAAACALSLAVTLPAAAEDLTIVSKVVVPTPFVVGPVNGTSSLWMSPGMVRHADGTHDWIYEVTTGRKIALDHQKKEYEDTTQEQRERELQALNEAARVRTEAAERSVQELKAKNDEELAKLAARTKEMQEQGPKRREELVREWQKLTPDEQKAVRQQVIALRAKLEHLKESRAEAEQELANLPPALRDNLDKPRTPIAVATTERQGTETRKIAGYDCEQRIVTDIGTFADGSKETMRETELWVAPGLEPPVPVDVVRQLVYLWRGDAPNGFPLALIDRFKGRVESSVSVEAVEIRKGAIDPSVFAVPAGYTRVESHTARTLEEWKRQGP